MTATEETVQVSKVELASIIKMNQDLMAKLGGDTRKPDTVKKHKATVFFIENQPVVGYMNRGVENSPVYIYEKPDPARQGEFLPYVDVVVRNADPKGQPTVYSLNYLEFMRECARQECEIVKVDKIPWVINQGVTTGRSFKEGTYYMIEGALVPVEVRGTTNMYTMALPDGTQVTLHERYVNISK